MSQSHIYAAPSKTHSSTRVHVGGHELFTSFWLMGLIDRYVSRESCQWPSIMSYRAMCTWGRPLWGAYAASDPNMTRTELLRLVKEKLTAANTAPAGLGNLALVASLMPLKFAFND